MSRILEKSVQTTLQNLLENTKFLTILAAVVVMLIITIIILTIRNKRRRNFHKYYKDPKLEERYNKQHDDSKMKSGLISNLFNLNTSNFDQGKLSKPIDHSLGKESYAEIINQEKTGDRSMGDNSSSIGFSKFNKANHK